jgi:hypothetical protein
MPGTVDGAEAIGERNRVLSESIGAVVANSVSRGKEAGENRRMRRHRDRHGCNGIGKAHALAGQLVDRGGAGQRETVAAEVIDAKGVDGDDQDVRTLRPGGRRR